MIPVPCQMRTKMASVWGRQSENRLERPPDRADSARIDCHGSAEGGPEGRAGRAATGHRRQTRSAPVAQAFRPAGVGSAGLSACPRGTIISFRGSRPMPTVNSFGTRTALAVGGRTYQIYSLPSLQGLGFPEIARLPYSMKILLENLLRHEDGRFVKAADVEAFSRWDAKSSAQKEISFAPA